MAATAGAPAASAAPAAGRPLERWVTPFALVNGAAGVLSWQGGRLIAVLGFTVAHGKIVAIDVLADPDRLAALGT